jgi:hypothetical protein
MSISSSRKELFRNPTIKDKLSLFELLFDVKLLTVDLTLALLKIIHKELSTHQTRDHSAYKLYAESIELLSYHKPDVLQQVVDAWNPRKVTPPAEWFSHDSLNIRDNPKGT